MRIVVAPHDLAIGGSQINAIDLAAAVRDLGHEVSVYTRPGPLVDYIAERRLRYIAARTLRYRPAPSRIAQLAKLCRDHDIDVVHGYEWPPVLDAYFGPHLALGTPVVCTILSMSVDPLVPRELPLLVGTNEIAEAARAAGHVDVGVLEPPIDVALDHPGLDGDDFRNELGVGPNDLLVVSVSRLSFDGKHEALSNAIEATALIADRLPVHLGIVGDGPAEMSLRAHAEDVNARIGRNVVTLVGARREPRPAYAAADVVVGMGSSSLRAMAIGKPTIIQGFNGFSKVFDEGSLELFLHTGFIGGAGTERVGPEALADDLARLFSSPSLRADLAAFGRRTAVDRFSLERAAAILADLYHRAGTQRGRPLPSGVIGSAISAMRREFDQHRPSVNREWQAQLAEAEAQARGQG